MRRAGCACPAKQPWLNATSKWAAAHRSRVAVPKSEVRSTVAKVIVVKTAETVTVTNRGQIAAESTVEATAARAVTADPAAIAAEEAVTVRRTVVVPVAIAAARPHTAASL